MCPSKRDSIESREQKKYEVQINDPSIIFADSIFYLDFFKDQIKEIPGINNRMCYIIARNIDHLLIHLHFVYG